MWRNLKKMRMNRAINGGYMEVYVDFWDISSNLVVSILRNPFKLIYNTSSFKREKIGVANNNNVIRR